MNDYKVFETKAKKDFQSYELEMHGTRANHRNDISILINICRDYLDPLDIGDPLNVLFDVMPVCLDKGGNISDLSLVLTICMYKNEQFTSNEEFYYDFFACIVIIASKYPAYFDWVKSMILEIISEPRDLNSIQSMILEIISKPRDLNSIQSMISEIISESRDLNSIQSMISEIISELYNLNSIPPISMISEIISEPRDLNSVKRIVLNNIQLSDLINMFNKDEEIVKKAASCYASIKNTQSFIDYYNVCMDMGGNNAIEQFFTIYPVDIISDYLRLINFWSLNNCDLFFKNNLSEDGTNDFQFFKYVIESPNVSMINKIYIVIKSMDQSSLDDLKTSINHVLNSIHYADISFTRNYGITELILIAFNHFDVDSLTDLIKKLCVIIKPKSIGKDFEDYWSNYVCNSKSKYWIENKKIIERVFHYIFGILYVVFNGINAVYLNPFIVFLDGAISNLLELDDERYVNFIIKVVFYNEYSRNLLLPIIYMDGYIQDKLYELFETINVGILLRPQNTQGIQDDFYELYGTFETFNVDDLLIIPQYTQGIQNILHEISETSETIDADNSLTPQNENQM